MTASKPGRPKGLPKTGGRPRGSQNKMTRELREMVQIALSELGGIAYLTKMGRERPELFVRLVTRCIPQAVEVTNDHDDLPLVTFNFAGKPINGDDSGTEQRRKS